MAPQVVYEAFSRFMETLQVFYGRSIVLDLCFGTQKVRTVCAFSSGKREDLRILNVGKDYIGQLYPVALQIQTLERRDFFGEAWD